VDAWDNLLKRAHAVYINPYDPEKHVWVVDDYSHALFKFSNDGKRLVQTIGTPGESGADDKHFNRPTFLAWLRPDSTMFVADGYNGTRVAKFDKNGRFLLAWGQKGNPPTETRPGYFNVVHGIAVDPVARRVYVSDRGNRRMQVFDENGKFVDQWPFATPSSVNFLFVSADRQLWAFDDTTAKIVRYDFEGHPLYAWGTLGDWPGGLFNIHGASVDQEGNLYVAEVANGRAQKFRPRMGANPEFVVGKPVYSAWK
jgi:peptidylamidoglycolate lyase